MEFGPWRSHIYRFCTPSTSNYKKTLKNADCWWKIKIYQRKKQTIEVISWIIGLSLIEDDSVFKVHILIWIDAIEVKHFFPCMMVSNFKYPSILLDNNRCQHWSVYETKCHGRCNLTNQIGLGPCKTFVICCSPLALLGQPQRPILKRS